MAGGGPITAAVDVPGGPILAGDHRRRDRHAAAAYEARLCTTANSASLYFTISDKDHSTRHFLYGPPKSGRANALPAPPSPPALLLPYYTGVTGNMVSQGIWHPRVKFPRDFGIFTGILASPRF